jgi:hypothetical protein
MRKLLNKPWFVVLLALVAVLAVGQSLLDLGKRPGAGYAAAGSDETAPEDSGDSAAEAPPQTLREALASLTIPEILPDPFLPRASIARATQAGEPATIEPDILETVRLSAIWKQDGDLLLLLNGRIYHAGETLGRLKIDAASLDGIWLSHWKGRDFLPLGGTFTLVTPARQAASQKLVHHES